MSEKETNHLYPIIQATLALLLVILVPAAIITLAMGWSWSFGDLIFRGSPFGIAAFAFFLKLMK